MNARALNFNSTTVAICVTNFYPIMLQEISFIRYLTCFIFYMLTSFAEPHFNPNSVPNQIFFTSYYKNVNWIYFMYLPTLLNGAYLT